MSTTAMSTVTVWTLRTDVAPDVLARCHDLLDDTERTRAAAFVHETDRRRFIVAHGALRLVLGRELGVPARRLAFTSGRHGKPRLTPFAGLHMSLSHCADLAAVATSPAQPVGVDIQQHVRGDVAAMATRFFAPEEARYVVAAPDDDSGVDRFTRLWTRKEAVVKAAGTRLWPNLGMPVHRHDVVQCVAPRGPHRVTDLVAPQGSRLAVALPGAEPYDVRVGAFRWS